MKLIRILDQKETKALQTAITALKWKDGAGSARGRAVKIKKNLQSYPDTEEFAPIQLLVETKIKELLQYLAFPQKIVGLRASLYREGHGEYDWHVDMPTMQGEVVDLSFTLFVSDQNAYEGGELEIDRDGTLYTVKGDSGEIVVYSSGDRHRVRPVVKGDRVVIVGWISSHVRNEADRNALTSLQQVLGMIDEMQNAPADIGLIETKLEQAREILNDNLHRLIRSLSR